MTAVAIICRVQSDRAQILQRAKHLTRDQTTVVLLEGGAVGSGDPPVVHVVVDLGRVVGVVESAAQVAVGLRAVLLAVTNLVVRLPPESNVKHL